MNRFEWEFIDISIIFNIRVYGSILIQKVFDKWALIYEFKYKKKITEYNNNKNRKSEVNSSGLSLELRDESSMKANGLPNREQLFSFSLLILLVLTDTHSATLIPPLPSLRLLFRGYNTLNHWVLLSQECSFRLLSLSYCLCLWPYIITVFRVLSLFSHN